MVDFYRFEHFNKQKGLLHAVTMKSIHSPYALSMALHTGEEVKRIMQNREKIASALDTNRELRFVVANQTHSDHIKIISTAQDQGWQSLEDVIEDCDAMITNLQGVVLTILTADCVPVLLYDQKKKVVAAVHAGWKGTKAKIVAKTVEKMKEMYGCDPADIIAGIAPAIGRCCYEVEEDVAKYFFDTPEGFTQVDQKYMLDLPWINKKQLLDVGVREENIEMSHICTACNVKDFFSYRKEKGCSGRFMSIIGLV